MFSKGSHRFSQGGGKVVKLRFTYSKLRKGRFLLKMLLRKCQISKSREAKVLPRLSTLMLDAVNLSIRGSD